MTFSSGFLSFAPKWDRPKDPAEAVKAILIGASVGGSADLSTAEGILEALERQDFDTQGLTASIEDDGRITVRKGEDIILDEKLPDI